MDRTKRYILSSFAKTYLLVFIPFMMIVSLVFIIQISVLSSKIDLKASELFEFFGFMIPNIFFYTIPFSLMTALASTFTRLSEESELVAIFALGHTPIKILKYMFPTVLLFAILLLVLSIMLFPQMKQKMNNFKKEKIAQATLNIEPNKLTQKFGDYSVYVRAKGTEGYRDIVLFHKDKKGKYKLLMAKEAKIQNRGGVFTLSLKDGIADTSDERKVENIRYNSLTIYKYPKSEDFSFYSFKEYWAKAKKYKSRRKKLLYLIFVSLSPLFSFGLIMGLSLFNPRYKRNSASMVIFISAVIIYTPAAILERTGNLYLFTIFSLSLTALNFYMIRFKIVKSF
jgi:lipopolysaccharide export system permease protein